MNDSGLGLLIDFGAGTGDLTVNHLDATGIIDFAGRGGFRSVDQVMGDLKSEGGGNYSLVLPDGSGTVSILSTSVLSANNFRIS